MNEDNQNTSPNIITTGTSGSSNYHPTMAAILPAQINTTKRNQIESISCEQSNRMNKLRLCTKTIFRLDYHQGVYVKLEIPVMKKEENKTKPTKANE